MWGTTCKGQLGYTLIPWLRGRAAHQLYSATPALERDWRKVSWLFLICLTEAVWYRERTLNWELWVLSVVPVLLLSFCGTWGNHFNGCGLSFPYSLNRVIHYMGLFVGSHGRMEEKTHGACQSTSIILGSGIPSYFQHIVTERRHHSACFPTPFCKYI